MKNVQIFTDGCCKGNPGPGGYGFIIIYKDASKEYKGAEKETTNNIMEMTAAIKALEQLKEPCKVDLTTDSQYLVKGMTQWIDGWARKGWTTSAKKPVKNLELWKKLQRLSQKHKISWHWIKGHAGHAENERCDALANEGMALL